jgi:hypothetical protein
MAGLTASQKLNEYKRGDQVRKLIELKFYKAGDICDLPLVAPEMWSEMGNAFNDQICKPNGLELVDQSNGTWKFIQFPAP